MLTVEPPAPIGVHTWLSRHPSRASLLIAIATSGGVWLKKRVLNGSNIVLYSYVTVAPWL